VQWHTCIQYGNLYSQFLIVTLDTKKYDHKVGEPITVGHLLSEGHHFYDEKTMKNEEKT